MATLSGMESKEAQQCNMALRLIAVYFAQLAISTTFLSAMIELGNFV